MSAPPKNTSRHEITIIVKRRNKTTNAQQVTLACVSTAHEARTHNAQPHQVDPASLSSLGFGCTHVREEHALQGPGLVSNHELHELSLFNIPSAQDDDCMAPLTISANFFAMTTGASDATDKGPSRQGSSSFGDRELHNETAGLSADRSRIGRSRASSFGCFGVF